VAGIPWTPAEEALCKYLVESGKDSAQIASEFQKQNITRTQKAIQRIIARKGWRAKIAPSPVQPIDPALEATGNIIILPDPHAPFHDAAWMERCIDLALKWGIKQVGIAGDLIDWTAFSFYGRQAGIEAETEICAAKQLTETLAGVFDKVYYCQGNHEVRLARMVGYALSLERIAEWWVTRENVCVTKRRYFWLTSADRRYMVIHPKNYSRIPGLNSTRLCAKYHVNIIGTHSHHWGMAIDVSGRYVGIDAGMCASSRLIDYVQEEVVTNPMMVQGACIVKDGVEYLLCPSNIGGYERMSFSKN